MKTVAIIAISAVAVAVIGVLIGLAYQAEPEKEFSLVYRKEGGIAGISESIIIDSSEKTLIKTTAQGQTEIHLDESQISLLLDTINEAELLSMGSLVYPPAEGWADYFTYTLRVKSGDVESDITWTDTNDVPKDLVLISQQIEELVPEPVQRLVPPQSQFEKELEEEYEESFSEFE